MSEPAEDILECDGFESGGDGVIQGFSGTRLYLLYPGFELREGELDRVEVRAVTGEKQQLATPRRDGLADMDASSRALASCSLALSVFFSRYT